MIFSSFLRRAKSSLKFWSATQQPDTDSAYTEFQLDEVAERVAKLKAPEPKEPTQFHSLVKLAPIPVPRDVRWESQALYMGAWAGTALLAWGGFEVPSEWLLWYGALAVLAFAALFRMEGPRTRAERLQREQEVQRCHEAYLQAEAHLKYVLEEGFNQRMDAFNTVRAAYDAACQGLDVQDTEQNRKLLSILANPLHSAVAPQEQLMEQMEVMEQKMLQLVDEMEDYSDTHKVAIDAAIMARHNARLAYWQAKLDEAALTGEAVQQH